MRLLVSLALALAGIVAVPGAAPAGPGAEDQVVHVSVTRDSLVASPSWASEGGVLFSVSGPGSVVLLQLEGEHTLDEVYDAFAKVFSGKPGPVRKLQRAATYYGGMFGSTAHADAQFAADLVPGVYQLADLGSRNAVTFEVLDVAESRRVPASTGTVTYTDNGIRMPKQMAPGGFMHLVNDSSEASIMDLVHAKPGTTRKQVKAYFASKGRRFAGRFTGPFDSTLLLSPGQEYWWAYSLPEGPAVAASFWPSTDNGKPQAWSGTWGMTSLR